MSFTNIIELTDIIVVYSSYICQLNLKIYVFLILLINSWIKYKSVSFEILETLQTSRSILSAKI